MRNMIPKRDCLVFDPFPFSDDSFVLSEVGVGGCDVIEG
ncbi:hypothetical protein GGR95_003681 [Sulfitobacter undariae]|uniref:Uncharacterized protein n=1 Tax=Sulfitobacter undariae TaxID=1563671 RepID=A0A7W6ECC6_9RHOB|nr:hypothetical protein [Sulfitobacter undariae]